MKITKTLAAISLTLSSISFSSQAYLADTAQDWQTFETANFRVHYTPEYRQWALSSAREMELVRTLVQAQQGRVLTEKVDAYIIDPFNAANGFAMPLSNKPYMALFTTPPLSDSIIANSTGWQQLLVLHEYVHLVHLAQKSRSPWRNTLANWYDLYDASQIKGERWVSEGYATLLESKLTGRGRLYNNHVEAIIQQFARQGALPTYSQLSDINDNYLSGSMAYLVGVRYLKWLEENYGEQTLDAVWTRWHGVKNRDFEQAFAGVFPDSAEHLYQRFVVEYTVATMQKEAKINKEHKAKLWLDLTGSVSAPTLSPNGEHLAIIEKNRKSNRTTITLNVYKTTKNTEKEEEFNQEMAELLTADPQDIADKAPTVFKREQAYSLNQINHRGINNPRWLNDDTLIYGASSLAKQNDYHQDLFSWHLPSNTVTQLTYGQNLRRFDITANGQSIIAERNRYGYSQLVTVSLALENQGEVTQTLTSKSLEKIYDFPRFRPSIDGIEQSSFAYLESNLNNKWQLKVRDLDTTNGTNKEQIIPLPHGYQFLSFPQWSKDGQALYYVAGINGATKLYRYNFTDKSLVSLTSGEHPVTWPEVQNDDNLLYLATNIQGPDVYQLDISKANIQPINHTTQSAEITNELASDFKLTDASIVIDESIGEHKLYGLGPQQGTITIGESYYSASSSLFELGYKSGDVLGRFDWQINLSKDLFSDIISGASATTRWQGWPIKLLAHGYQFNLTTQQQESSALALGKIAEQGLFVEARYPYQHETFSLDIFAQIKAAQIKTTATKLTMLNVALHPDLSSQYLSLGFAQAWSFDQQNWGIKQDLTAQFITGDNEQAQLPMSQQVTSVDYSGSNGQFSLSAHIKNYALGFNYHWAQRSTDAGNILSLGGYSSTLIQAKAHANKQLAPELAFYRQAGNDYQSYQAFITLRVGEFFYTRHKMDQQTVIDSYGFKGELTNNFGFTGITNIAINYGLAQVNPENEASETQVWLGLGYQW
ncbi:MAG: hypothetical protein COB83_02670 [Gammaproteobacteria bacterium]|nr:MAG: hypothetical protein COB83_02670 [Gammaproteobacteria bacterium]